MNTKLGGVRRLPWGQLASFGLGLLFGGLAIVAGLVVWAVVSRL